MLPPPLPPGQNMQQQQQPANGGGGGPTPHGGPGGTGGGGFAPFVPRQHQPVTYTAGTFAQTKFGSTKLKSNGKKTNRMSPTEFSNYIKQRAMQKASINGCKSEFSMVKAKITLLKVSNINFAQPIVKREIGAICPRILVCVSSNSKKKVPIGFIFDAPSMNVSSLLI